MKTRKTTSRSWFATLLVILRAAFMLPMMFLLAVPGDGGSEDGKGGDGKGGTEGDEDDGDEDDGDEEDDDFKDLPDKAKTALRTERSARAAAEKESKRLAKEVKRISKEVENAKHANASDDEKKILAAKDEARKEALGVANVKLVKAAVRAVAATKMASPELAPGLLDLEDFDVDDDGDVDEDKIARALDKLLEAHPELKASSNGKRKSGADFSGKGKDKKPDMNDLLRAAAGR